MNALTIPKSVFFAGHDSHDSSKVHGARVKHENVKIGIYIDKKKNSLSSFTYSPVPPPPRVCVRPRGSRGETSGTPQSFPLSGVGCVGNVGEVGVVFATVGPRGSRGQCLARSPPAGPDATDAACVAHGASAKVARPKTTCRPANRYFPAIFSKRRQREPTQG